jgi:Ca2+-transporting ATPase
VICTDKTGTLTKGLFVLDQVVPFGGATERDVLEAAVLASEVPPSDPMEKAIREYAGARGVEADGLISHWRLVRDHDFDPIGKHMSHVWAPTDDSEKARVVAKGALEGILEHANAGTDARAEIERAHTTLAASGIRVLAVAERPAAQASGTTRADDERGLKVLGLLGFRDPMRPEVPGAVRECQAAGVRIKIVTGDHALTAHAIAESAGIIHRDDAIVTGDQLAAASRDERRRLIVDASILSRITPPQKHMIVEELRSEGEIVAMTGDGINDAPALRRADIGVSMGQRGTDVARAAADLVLLDDNFASIVAAVREGRKIFLDIQRAFLYLLAFHIPIVGLALLPPILGMPLLLLPLHLVWLELIVHPVSALLFQGDAPPADLMTRPPRDPRAPMLARASVIRSSLSGALLTVAALVVYGTRLAAGPKEARGLALATLILGYQMLVLIERAGTIHRLTDVFPRSVRFWLIWVAAAASLPILMYLPATAAMMNVDPMSPAGWCVALGAASVAVGWRFLAGLRKPTRRAPGAPTSVDSGSVPHPAS